MLRIPLSGEQMDGVSIALIMVIGFSVGLLAWWIRYRIDVRDIVTNGGLKSYYGYLIKRIMRFFPDAVTVSDTPVRMAIESYDETKGVKMMLFFDINTDKNLNVQGDVIPDPERWPGMSPKKFCWDQIPLGYGQADEARIVFYIKKDMVFNPATF